MVISCDGLKMVGMLARSSSRLDAGSKTPTCN